MREYKIEYHYGNFGGGPREPSIAIVEAESPELAEALLRDKFTRSGRGDGKYIHIVDRIREYQRPDSRGRVISL